ncbi:MAG TPA: hypothetical protein VLV54_06110 [Thermoanaerobaculia bacterium]|nr:hypothetical protein [Thermoanaerobaculia bacterium]
MSGVVLVYAGLISAFIGAVGTLWPLRILGLSSRWGGAALLALGVLIVVAGWALPAPETRVASPSSRLDEFMPAWQFSEHHTTRVKAPPARVFRAIHEVTANEILFFRTLTSIRRFGRPGPESILNAPERKPILEVATRTTFLQLAEEPDRELVVGTLVVAPRGTVISKPTPEAFKALERPGFAKAAMNFRVEADSAGGSILTTETRVYATDAASKHRFAAYWRVIYPGSALIRRMWLRAIVHRAEAGI